MTRSDVNKFACNGGAMDCVSVDREGIHPFFTAAVAMHRKTGRIRYLKWAKQALASIYDLSPEDLLWLEAHSRPMQ